jgi:hypothetical protein
VFRLRRKALVPTSRSGGPPPAWHKHRECSHHRGAPSTKVDAQVEPRRTALFASRSIILPLDTEERVSRLPASDPVPARAVHRRWLRGRERSEAQHPFDRNVQAASDCRCAAGRIDRCDGGLERARVGWCVPMMTSVCALFLPPAHPPLAAEWLAFCLRPSQTPGRRRKGSLRSWRTLSWRISL